MAVFSNNLASLSNDSRAVRFIIVLELFRRHFVRNIENCFVILKNFDTEPANG